MLRMRHGYGMHTLIWIAPNIIRRLLLRATTRALLAQQAFWRLLRHSTLQFNTLTSAFRNIEAAQEAALKTYRSVLERCA